jgi:exopolysaccharide production protein ExoQ
MCADVLTVILLLRTRDAEEEALSIVKGFVVGSAVVAAIAWLAPVMDDLRLGNEDFLHPNAIGFEFALATLCALYLSREGRIWKWLGVIPGVTLLRTLSKASILAFLPAAGFYLLRASSIRRRTKVLVAIGAVLVSLSFLSLIDAYVEQYAQGSQLETLTGRTLIWAESLDIALDKPWLGHGFYSYRWLVPPFGTFEAWQAHDELLQQFFSYGLVGILLSVALYYGFFRQLRRHPPDNLRTLATALLIFALLRGLVDTDIFGLSFPLWLMAMLTIWLDSRRATGSRHHASELRV